jgi:cell wall-associated NlpC family hydrolase
VKAALAAGLLLVLLPVAMLTSVLGGDQALPSATALADIPAHYLVLYERAALRFGLPWELLAAVGKVESNHGRDPGTDVPNAAGAVGPMQFEPATFASYSWAAGSADPDIDDPRDAIEAAAAMLAADGAPAATRRALYDYNHADWYVEEVLGWAGTYEAQAASSGVAGPSAPAADAVAYALSQLGVPYRWGGEGSDGFDCSGLSQAAYRAGGIELPRTAQAQYDAGPAVPPGVPLEPGDLVFFGSGPADVSHVGILVDTGEMVDAPHSGAVVRVEPYDWPDYLGATRPAAADDTGA